MLPVHTFFGERYVFYLRDGRQNQKRVFKVHGIIVRDNRYFEPENMILMIFSEFSGGLRSPT